MLLPDTKQHCCFKLAILKYIGGMSVSGFQLVGIVLLVSYMITIPLLVSHAFRM